MLTVDMAALKNLTKSAMRPLVNAKWVAYDAAHLINALWTNSAESRVLFQLIMLTTSGCCILIFQQPF